MRIDWQKYEDGLLSPEETTMADEMLQTDEGARKELEGLRSFRKAVRGAALSEAVPHSRLRQILRKVVGANKAPVLPRVASFTTIAAGAVAMAFLAWNAFFSDEDRKEFVESRRQFESELEAREWASNYSGVDLPTLQLASLGKFEAVHCGRGWACFDYRVDGQLIHVYMKKNNIDDSCSVVNKGDQTFFVDDGISFEEHGLTVSVKGASEEVRWKVADYTMNTPDAIY